MNSFENISYYWNKAESWSIGTFQVTAANFCSEYLPTYLSALTLLPMVLIFWQTPNPLQRKCQHSFQWTTFISWICHSLLTLALYTFLLLLEIFIPSLANFELPGLLTSKKPLLWLQAGLVDPSLCSQNTLFIISALPTVNSNFLFISLFSPLDRECLEHKDSVYFIHQFYASFILVSPQPSK